MIVPSLSVKYLLASPNIIVLIEGGWRRLRLQSLSQGVAELDWLGQTRRWTNVGWTNMVSKDSKFRINLSCSALNVSTGWSFWMENLMLTWILKVMSSCQGSLVLAAVAARFWNLLRVYFLKRRINAVGHTLSRKNLRQRFFLSNSFFSGEDHCLSSHKIYAQTD